MHECVGTQLTFLGFSHFYSRFMILVLTPLLLQCCLLQGSAANGNITQALFIHTWKGKAVRSCYLAHIYCLIIKFHTIGTQKVSSTMTTVEPELKHFYCLLYFFYWVKLKLSRNKQKNNNFSFACPGIGGPEVKL